VRWSIKSSQTIYILDASSSKINTNIITIDIYFYGYNKPRMVFFNGNVYLFISAGGLG